MQTLTYKWIIIPLLFISISYAFAQPPMHSKKRMETLKKMKLLEVLELTEEQSNVILSKYDIWSDKIKEKKDELDEAHERLNEALMNSAKESEIIKLSDEFLEKYREFFAVFKERSTDFRNTLSPVNYARFLVFEKEFPEKLQKEIMKRQRKNKNH